MDRHDLEQIKTYFEYKLPIYAFSDVDVYSCPTCLVSYENNEQNRGKYLYQLSHDTTCQFMRAYNAILRLEESLKQKYNRQQLVLREIQADIEQLRDEWNNSQITEWSKGILLSIQRELEDNLQKSE